MLADATINSVQMVWVNILSLWSFMNIWYEIYAAESYVRMFTKTELVPYHQNVRKKTEMHRLNVYCPYRMA